VGEDDWVEALYEIYRDPDLAYRLGVEGRAVAETCFSVPIIAERLAGILKDIGAPDT